MVHINPVGSCESTNPYGISNQSLVDHFTAGLDSATKKCVRCITHIQPLGLCKSQNFFSFFYTSRKRLFRVDMLAGIKGCQADFSMSGRDSKIQHTFYARILNNLVRMTYPGDLIHFSLSF